MTRTLAAYETRALPPIGAMVGTARAARGIAVAVPERDGFGSLDAIGVVVHVERDKPIFYAGDPADYYYKVVDGVVRLSDMLADGRRQIIDFVKPSHYFGFSAEEEHLFQAEAVTDVTLMRYQRRRVDGLFAEKPSVARLVMDVTHDSMRALQRQLVLLGRRTAKERLAAFLLDYAASVKTDAKGFFQLPMSRRDIADYLGLTIETVSRVFGDLKRAHEIELRGSHDVALRRPEDLAQMIQ